jgi:hypothetical protein
MTLWQLALNNLAALPPPLPYTMRCTHCGAPLDEPRGKKMGNRFCGQMCRDDFKNEAAKAERKERAMSV